MNWADCNFDSEKDCAVLYGISASTLARWKNSGCAPIPWRDPYLLKEWYHKMSNRRPGKRLDDRINILQAQMLHLEQHCDTEESHPGPSYGAVGDPSTNGDYRPLFETKKDRGVSLDRSHFYEEICSDLANARTIARINSEEREAYENYKDLKSRDRDYSAEVRRWQDLTKVKREWAKTQDSVDLAFVALRNWLRSEWEPQWKELRTALDGRRLGMDAREDLKLVAHDPVEWRRVWDMHMERVILNVLDKQNDEPE